MVAPEQAFWKLLIHWVMALACAVEPSDFSVPLKQLMPIAPLPPAGLLLLDIIEEEPLPAGVDPPPPFVPPELLHAAIATAPASRPAAIPARLSFTCAFSFFRSDRCCPEWTLGAVHGAMAEPM